MPVLLWPLIGPVRIEKSVTSLYEVARQTRQRGRRGARTRGGIEKCAGLRALTGRLVIVVRRSTPSDTDIRAADPASAGVEVRVRIVGNHAEELGVEIYPGFSASEVVYHEDSGAVKGIATRDVGINKDGTPKDTFMRGMELHGKQTLFAEGARGSCSEEIISKFNLREGKDPQVYGLGIRFRNGHSPGLSIS